ncbi:hypothetical protein [Azospirillum thermophilum]|uniref:Uncharacterized protein n=1 Tax=Azospirillum thermophilum TaxID=2202148 RepID=A0A2S2CPW8_9PROT|nr:hypothetical protein [Azospirillum thermophilum]AWK86420.1 hypothetical protein DEW08_09355 [Azospirillum thermophilum]
MPPICPACRSVTADRSPRPGEAVRRQGTERPTVPLAARCAAHRPAGRPEPATVIPLPARRTGLWQEMMGRWLGEHPAAD